MEKGENAVYQHLLLFLQCSQKAFTYRASNVIIVCMEKNIFSTQSSCPPHMTVHIVTLGETLPTSRALVWPFPCVCPKVGFKIISGIHHFVTSWKGTLEILPERNAFSICKTEGGSQVRAQCHQTKF